MSDQHPLSEVTKSWENLDPETMEAVYSVPLIREVYLGELQWIRQFLNPESVVLEVGCGTGRFCLALLGHVHRVVGLDISEDDLEFIRARNRNRSDLLLIKGDAANLTQVLNAHPECRTDFWDRRRIVCCVMNTLGVMPAGLRQSVVTEMVKTCGPNGVLFFVVFNRQHFERGVNELYKPNPDLTGPMEDGDISWDTADVRGPKKGYASHWFSKGEIIDLITVAGVKDYQIRDEPGVGLYVVGGA